MAGRRRVGGAHLTARDSVAVNKVCWSFGDFNPIHTIHEAAEKAGLPGVIAYPMLTLATVGLIFSPYLEYGYVKELKARFWGMVFLGDEIIVGGRVMGAEDAEGPGRSCLWYGGLPRVQGLGWVRLAYMPSTGARSARVCPR